MAKTQYPYEPPQGYKFVDIKNPFMQAAMLASKELAFDTGINVLAPIGLVLVKDGKVLLRTMAGSDYHQKFGCERQKLGIVNGEYEQCPGCSNKIHAEQNAIRQAQDNNIDITGADAYLFGHFWYCEPCCKALAEKGIVNLYLLDDANLYFDRSLATCKRGDFEFFKSLLQQ
jgi:deoxycytidylate deaminase